MEWTFPFIFYRFYFDGFPQIVYAVPVGGAEYLQRLHLMFRHVLTENNVRTETRSYNPHLTLFNTNNDQQVRQQLLGHTLIADN